MLASSGIAKPRGDGQAVAEGAGRAGHRSVGGSPVGGVDQPAQLVNRQRPAIVAAVLIGVEPGHPPQGVLWPSGRRRGTIGRTTGSPAR